jgi:hypothetical protein
VRALGLRIGVAVAALGTLAWLVPACATAAHRALVLGEDDAATPVGDAGVMAPAALGVSVFGITCDGGAPTAAWSPVRRVSRVEYDNMVRDLLGDTTQPASGFAPESPMVLGVNLDTNTYTGVSTLIAQQYLQAAEALAEAVVSDSTRLSAILPCKTQDDACAQQFIAAFANRAFRGQLDADASAALLALYTTVKTQYDFATGIQAVLAAVLESPRFLYVIEFGDGQPAANTLALSSYEVAGRLSLFLWRSVPDQTLMDAAGAGQLATADQVRTQAARMLADPKARDAIDDFATQWLELESTATKGKDTQFTAWNGNSKIGQELKDETLTNVDQLVLTANGDLTTLLTSSSSYVNGDLAAFYGVSMGSGAAVSVADPALSGSATEFTSTTLPYRAGVLTNGSVLATQAHTTLPSSVLRGKLVREDILCDTLHPPPPGVPPPPTSVPEGGTTRSEFLAHATTPGCVNCHTFMDPIGVGFGHFDATGAYQATDANGYDGGFPAIDATGQVNAMNPGELKTSFDGATDLATKLAASTQARQCFTLQEFRYALSRIEGHDDACSLGSIYRDFSSSSLNIQKLMISITASDAFRNRSAITAGSACQ